MAASIPLTLLISPTIRLAAHMANIIPIFAPTFLVLVLLGQYMFGSLFVRDSHEGQY